MTTIQERLAALANTVAIGVKLRKVIVNDAIAQIDADEALMREAMYALDFAADMTKPDGLSGCDCPICTVSKALEKRLEKAE